MRNYIMALIVALFLSSCEIKPKPIDYGTDNCAYCSMTIVDKQHAAELVTEKGRAYKFDAIECMINYDRENQSQLVQLYLTNDFNSPGALIDATSATYLVSEEFSSPMGANLSAFSSKGAAMAKKEEFGGEIYDWDELRKSLEITRINNNPKPD